MFSSPRTVKAPPFIFTLETRECNGESGQEAVQGSRGEPRGGESRLLRESRRGGGRGKGQGRGRGGGQGRGRGGAGRGERRGREGGGAGRGAAGKAPSQPQGKGESDDGQVCETGRY